VPEAVPLRALGALSRQSIRGKMVMLQKRCGCLYSSYMA